jgi:hypothetical protein
VGFLSQGDVIRNTPPESDDLSNTMGVAGPCALSDGGVVRCYRDGSWVTDVLTNVRALSAGSEFSHVCALTTTGRVFCWGDNDYGQLGDGTIARGAEPRREEPAPVLGICENAQ